MFAEQIIWLLIISLPVACVSWTFTHAELFREARHYFTKRNKEGKTIFERKFFFLLICDYCFSHYVTILFLIITHFKLLYDDWRGYVISGFSIVWIANIYINLFTRMHVTLKRKRFNLRRLTHENDDGGH